MLPKNIWRMTFRAKIKPISPFPDKISLLAVTETFPWLDLSLFD